jgi:hypothetical protein
MDHCAAAGRRRAVGAGAPAGGALPDLSRHRRRAAGLRAIVTVLDAGASPRTGAVRRAGAAGCRLRHLAARSPAQLDSRLDPGRRRGRSHDRRRRGAGAWAGSGHAVGGCDRARGHRGTARCCGRDRHPAPGQAALSDAQDPRRRKPAQRCERTADLSDRDRGVGG